MGRPFEAWSLECNRRRSIAGFTTRLYTDPDTGAADVAITAYCRSVAHLRDPVLVRSPPLPPPTRTDATELGLQRVPHADCRLTEPFELATGSVTAEDGSAGCVDAEFLNAIYAEYKDGVRTLVWTVLEDEEDAKLICCL